MRLIHWIKDRLEILRLWREEKLERQHQQFSSIHGIPVNALSHFSRNQWILDEIEQSWGEVDLQLKPLLELMTEALKAVGKNIDTDIYLERSLLEGAKEKDAAKQFLVERHEADRALLMMSFDRTRIDAQTKATPEVSAPTVQTPSWQPLEHSRRGFTGSVLDQDYSQTTFDQADFYLNRLYQEDAIIHVLGHTRKIIRVLYLPYELPKVVYDRQPFIPLRSLDRVESSSLTEVFASWQRGEGD